MYTLRLKNQNFNTNTPIFFPIQKNIVIWVMLCIFVIEILACLFVVKNLVSINETSYAADVAEYYKPGIATEQFMSTLASENLDPVLGQKVTRAPFSVDGVIVLLGGDNIQIFEYADPTTAGQDISLLEEKYTTRKRTFSSNETTYLYTKGTLTIFYMGNNKNILDVLSKNAELSLIEPKKLVL